MNTGFDGEQYRAASTHQKEWGTKLIAELKLVGTEHILDLGSGDGALTVQLASLVPHGQVVGIDSSQSMIDAARGYRHPNLKFELLDINALACEAKFDVVFSNATLHWIRDHRSLLSRVFRALRQGGTLRVNFAADGNCSTFNRIVQELMADRRYAGFFRDFEWPWYMPRLDDYHMLVSQFPFLELKVWGENADRYFPDAGAMVRWIDQPSIIPFLSRIAEGQKKGFRDDVVNRMIHETRQADNRCFETFRRINISARKLSRSSLAPHAFPFEP